MPTSTDFETVLRSAPRLRLTIETCTAATQGREFNPDSLEPLWRELRTNKNRYLQPSDLYRVFEEGKTIYGHYWRLSKVTHWGIRRSRCMNRSGRIAAGRRKLSNSSLAVLQDWKLLSSVYPEDLAVYSPPIMSILHVPSYWPVQHYVIGESHLVQELR
jgi:hypothetical protein